MFDNLEVIPQGLDEMEPGPVLAALLSSIDVSDLSGHDRIVMLRAYQRLVSHSMAQVYEDMAAVSEALYALDDDPQLATESAVAEIRAALRLTRRAADSELTFAHDLQRRLPRVLDSLAEGDIDVRRAKAIVFATTHLPSATAREVVDRGD